MAIKISNSTIIDDSRNIVNAGIATATLFSGKVSFPLGTAALPSLYPGTDTDTGIWSPDADQLSLSTGGTARLFVDSSGNFGVGGTAAYKLYITGTTTAGGIRVEDSSASSSAPGIEVIGKRSDGNTSSSFAGKLLLSKNKTSAAIQSANVLGSVAFGGNHTDGTLANILYSASIQGIADGAFNSATDMPTALVFLTGNTGRSPDTANVDTGTERARITSAGNFLIGTTTGTELLTVSGNVQATTFIGNLTGTASINNGPLAGMRNAIINGSMAIAQRGTSFVAADNDDDSYNLDRWYVLSDGNDVVDITQNTATIPTNGKYAMALDVETINKKFGIAQIIEADSCTGLIGSEVTLSFKGRVSATTNLDNVKAAIVAWSGTADTVTSDIVSAWGVEGTNPTLVANATYENTPANLNLTTSYATYSITATIDRANTKNIIVFIWSDVTTTSLSEFLYITDVQLEIGPVATPFERRPIGAELALCQRYCIHMEDSGSAGAAFSVGRNRTTTVFAGLLHFPTRMRVAPSLTTSGTAANYRIRHANTTTAVSVVPTIADTTRYGTYIEATVASGLTVGQSSALDSASGSAFLRFEAEL